MLMKAGRQASHEPNEREEKRVIKIPSRFFFGSENIHFYQDFYKRREKCKWKADEMETAKNILQLMSFQIARVQTNQRAIKILEPRVGGQEITIFVKTLSNALPLDLH